VTGTNLDSVANPRIILSVVITHFSTTLGPTPQVLMLNRVKKYCLGGG